MSRGTRTASEAAPARASRQVLQPLIDPTFSEHSHGAVLETQQYVQAGYRTVVDVDLEKLFDRVDHDILMDRLAKRIADKPFGALRLSVEAMHRSGTYGAGCSSHVPSGRLHSRPSSSSSRSQAAGTTHSSSSRSATRTASRASAPSARWVGWSAAVMSTS